MHRSFWNTFAAMLVPIAAAAQAEQAPAGVTRCTDYNPLKNLYWGDLHTHTSYSLDAFAAGTRADPQTAYAFARGRTSIQLASGSQRPHPATARIDRPLDFLAVTDHSEWLGVMEECTLDPKNAGYHDIYCNGLRNQDSLAQLIDTGISMIPLSQKPPVDSLFCRITEGRRARCLDAQKSAWTREEAATEAANDRCKFTTFKAYEWTGQDGRGNLHRNVIFSGDKVPERPFDFVRYPTAVDLWKALASGCQEREGCDVITIPHNSNASYGKMWNTIESADALPLMQRYQTLVEIFQHKGASECLPGDPLADPTCDFEIVPGSFIDVGVFGKVVKGVGGPGYVRNGLAQGLSWDATHSVNPLAMGFVGATDTHNGTPGNVKEQGWPGHFGRVDDTPAGRLGNNRFFNPGGITGIWAEENTRESLFGALKRRETYGTSGTRLAVRFYEVSDVADDAAAAALCEDPSFPKRILEAGGVPMGSSFQAAKKPYLFVLALKDETDLASIDVVKLSSDAAGKGQLDLKAFPLSGTSKSKACVYYRDDAYDPGRPTLYYARVFEAPTWRWSHYDCLADPEANPKKCDPKLTVADEGLNVQVQERAWSSPVFARR
jgi:hypothetical protein